MRKSLFLYPIDSESIKEENNNYVRKLIEHLSGNFRIVNGPTEVGLLDTLLKFWKTDVYYFNWIENVPSKRFGFLQVLVLIILVAGCKMTNKKIIWFIHNNISHNREHFRTKKFITKLMAVFADLVFSHSNQIILNIPKKKLKVFHHPVEEYQPVTLEQPVKHDLLIWGSVYPYKGVSEFVEYVASNPFLQTKQILIAGKFSSDDYYQETLAKKTTNVTILNNFVTDERLRDFFSKSQYVLFTYSSPSVLSSAALCKTLSFGKEVIAPNIGSFRELGEVNLIYTYSSFEGIESVMKDLDENKKKKVNGEAMINYIQNTSWEAFALFLSKNINLLYARDITTSSHFKLTSVK